MAMDWLAAQLRDLTGPGPTAAATQRLACILGNQVEATPHELEEITASLLWFSYRRGFRQIGNTNFTTDTGWGCMLRCGQMMLAEALQRLHEPRSMSTARQILPLFADTPEAPFSIHNISLGCAMMQKDVGAWVGPNTFAQVIRTIINSMPLCELSVYVAMDLVVTLSDLPHRSAPWKPLLMFIPLRLGLQSLTTSYIEPLKQAFAHTNTVGLIGGKPNSAFYFLGTLGDDMLYLDPHLPQPVIDMSMKNFPLQSYRFETLERMPITQLDPTMCLGFLFRNQIELEDFIASNPMPSLFSFATTATMAATSNAESDFAMPPTPARGVSDVDDGDNDDDFELV